MVIANEKQGERVRSLSQEVGPSDGHMVEAHDGREISCVYTFRIPAPVSPTNVVIVGTSFIFHQFVKKAGLWLVASG